MSIARYAAFAIPGAVDVVEGQGGLPLVTITTKFAEAEVYLHGGHVAHFAAAGQKPLLWMSPASPFEDGKPIRGGIPLCFPWFGPHRTRKELPIHGCVRFRAWDLVQTGVLSDGRARIVLALDSDEASRAYWPHDFRAELTVLVGETLEVALTVTNTGREPFVYDDCFHTYFAVGDATSCLVGGLNGVGYIDRGKADARFVQNGDLPITEELVHVHVNAPARSEIRDPVWKRRIVIEQSGMAETVVWNPGEATAAKNPEMAGRWKEFLCVESANCLDGNVTLLPLTAHSSAVRYGVESL